MDPRILKITASGYPQSWISIQDAASDLAVGRVLYGFGETGIIMRGGYSKSGLRSELLIPAIISSRGHGDIMSETPSLNRRTLVRRDHYICQYCNRRFPYRDLTIDHIHPSSRGGQHVWTNVVTACFGCNNAKDDMTPEEAGMKLVSVPYTPNRFEHMYLRNHRVLADQMAFLEKGFHSFRAAG